MNHGLRLSFNILASLTELFSGQDYLASIDLSQRMRESETWWKARWDKHAASLFPRV